MADHAHQRILEAVQTALVAAATVAGSRVYLDRVDDLPTPSAPAIDIVGPEDVVEDENIEALAMHFPPLLQHALEFPVASVCAQKTGSAKAARNLAGQVEAALLDTASVISIGGIAIDMALLGSSEVKDGAGAVPMFAVRQRWRARYQTVGGAPDAPV